MQLSDFELRLTENSEGCRLTAYQDTGGVWTIGYGHTGKVKPHSTITQEQAEALLRLDLQNAESCVNAHALPCTQGQFDALVDFVFNVGASQFLSSHLYRYHAAGQYALAAAEFPKWKYDNGKVEPGLVVRRAREQSLYMSQEPTEDHPNTTASEHSDQPVACSAPASQALTGAQSSLAPLVPTPNTAPVSGSTLSALLAQKAAWLRKMLA